MPFAAAMIVASVWRAPLGSAVVPEEKYSHRQS